jgi:fatty-acyl-CoA synthase
MRLLAKQKTVFRSQQRRFVGVTPRRSPIMDMHFADIWEAMAAARPGRPAIVQGAQRLTWGDYEERAARLAAVLMEHNIVHGAKVGLYLYNAPEYLEAQFAAFKVRASPINVNYRYLDDELAYLLANAEVEAIVVHASLADRLNRVVDRLPQLRLVLEVDDLGGGRVVTKGGVAYASAVIAAAPAPPQPRSADDVYMLYTGGTTGLPKGVMYRMGDVVGSFLATTSLLYGIAPVTEADQAVGAALGLDEAGRQRPTLAAPPLMHGAGMWVGAMAPHLLGAPVVLTESRGLDADEMLDVLAGEGVRVAVIVGDAFARPLMDAFERRRVADRPDLGALEIIASSGAMLSAESKARLLEAVPGLMILDLLGSSEGSMGTTVAMTGLPPTTAKFRLNPGVRVLRDDDTDVAVGTGEVGTVALTSAMVPLGYYKDADKSALTFRQLDGVRYSLPGDMATVEEDGTITLLGRRSACVNTGGEKVYPEEVEEAVKTHPAVQDCLVFGVDDERLGQRVVAVASVAPPAEARPEVAAIVAHVKKRLAGYKVPREIVLVDTVPRAPNGKADYKSARSLFGG